MIEDTGESRLHLTLYKSKQGAHVDPCRDSIDKNSLPIFGNTMYVSVEHHNPNTITLHILFMKDIQMKIHLNYNPI